MQARRLLGLLTLAALAACQTLPTPSGVELAKQPPPAPTPSPASVSSADQETLRTVVNAQDRLYHVAAPLLTANTELCKAQARNLLGFSAKNRYSYSDGYAEAAQALFGLDERLQVTDVLAGSGAARAGIKRGDVLLSAEGKALPAGANATREAASVLAPLVNGKNSVALSLLRNGQPLNVTVPLTRACGFNIELGNTDTISAYNDGRRMLVTRGMLRFVRGQNELAFVLAREMAHNILAHQWKQKTAAAADSVIDNLIRMHPDASVLRGTGGIKPMPQDLDVAADNLAVYLAARAGYNIDDMPAFWNRMAKEVPPSVANGYTALHPSTVARLTAVELAVASVKEKQAAKKPLVP